MDVLDEIFKDTDMQYNLYLVRDGEYGKLSNETGNWNGIIGDVAEGVSTY